MIVNIVDYIYELKILLQFFHTSENFDFFEKSTVLEWK